MKEAKLREWHRYTGIILAVFIIFQAGSGLFISLNHLKITHSHAHSEVAVPHGSSYEHAGEKEHFHGEPISTSMHRKEQQISLSRMIDDIHHGGGLIGNLYRIILGLGVIGQTIGGGIIFFKIQQRSKSRRSMTA